MSDHGASAGHVAVRQCVDHEVMDEADTTSLPLNPDGTMSWNPGRRPIYTRSSSNIRRVLDQRIVNAYALPRHKKAGTNANGYPDQALKAVAFPSGMTAINCILMVTLERVCQGISHDTPDSALPWLILGNELYCDVARTVRYLRSLFRFIYEEVDVTNDKAVMRAVQKAGPNLAIVYIESCTNPSGQMMDVELVRKIKRVARRCIVCVDNTWLSSVVFNPFVCPAVDVVVESMTKYIGGGRCIGGMAVGASWILTKARKWVQIMGLFMPRVVCNTFVEGWDTLARRVHQSSAVALQIATELDALKQQPGAHVLRVLHPLLTSHPTHAVARRQLLSANACQLGPCSPGTEDRVLGPSVFLFCVDLRRKIDPDIGMTRGGVSAVRSDATVCAILSASGLPLETSYGSPYSKLEVVDYGWDCQYEPDGGFDPILGLWIRLAVGYQDTFEHLSTALKRMLAHIDTVPDNFPAEEEPPMFLEVPAYKVEQPHIVDRVAAPGDTVPVSGLGADDSSSREKGQAACP